MARKTTELYVKVFQKVQQLVPQFAPTCAMADFEEASVAGFVRVYPDSDVAGCWFHYAQAVIKRTNKLGLKDAYGSDADVQIVVQCLVSLPLLPPEEIVAAIDDVEALVLVDSSHENQLRELIRYVRRQWINKRSIGPERLSVRDNQSRTNNVVESYHAALRRRIKVSHPNLYSFLAHLQQLTVDQLNDVARLRNGLNIRRPKKKANMLNDKRIKSCLSRFDNGVYSRLQFLRAVRHSVGAHTECLQPRDDSSSSSSEDDEDTTPSQAPAPAATTSAASAPATVASAGSASTSEDSDFCEVCLVAPRAGFALVPCGHARFCEACARRVADMESGCPVCRADITLVMRVFM